MQCIIPPHVFKAMLKTGDADMAFAAEGLVGSAEIRSRRDMQPPAAAGNAKAPECLVYTSGNKVELPGKHIDDPTASNDEAARDAFAYVRHSLGFFKSLGRNSIDGRGMDVIATVHYRRHFPNAFWHDGQIVFGDGDRFFHRFTTPEIVGHELTHGVIQHTNQGLRYASQSGAINESFSDIFGVLIKQRSNLLSFDKTTDVDWLVGRGIFLRSDLTPDWSIGIRSVVHPGDAYVGHPVLGDDPQKSHMRDFKDIEEDNGGVHIYSGIPNRAFYLFAEQMQGDAWDAPARVWYKALKRLTSTAGFRDLAEATAEVADEEGGRTFRDAVESAWEQVGISIRVPVAVPGLEQAGVPRSLGVPGAPPMLSSEPPAHNVANIEEKLVDQLEQRILEGLELRLSARLDEIAKRVEDRLVDVLVERLGGSVELPDAASQSAALTKETTKKSVKNRPAKAKKATAKKSPEKRSTKRKK